MENLLAKYFAGECSDNEQKEVEDWRSESEKNAEHFMEFRETWLAMESITLSATKWSFQDEAEQEDVKVVGWRDGEIGREQICESAEEAAALAEQWAELDFTRIEIEDLSVEHQLGDILEPELEIEPEEPPPAP